MEVKIIRQRKVNYLEGLGFAERGTIREWVIMHKKCGFIRSLPPSDNILLCHHCRNWFESQEFIKLKLKVKKWKKKNQ
jgi:hypothetical protein